MKTTIVIPTYNEKENIEKLIKEIFSLNISNLKIIIIDDNSPDGTGELIEKIKKENSNIEVIHHLKKGGIGPAYVDGFKRALKLGADYIFEMDADFSHNPNYLPKFLEEIKNNDLVLGSRYIQEGKIENWNFTRKLISYLGNLYAKFILGLPFSDLTGGFKCYKRRVLENLNLDKINSQGYVFQIETTYLAHKNSFKIKEIPIIFTERKQGKSKFNLKIILESFLRVLLLRLKK